MDLMDLGFNSAVALKAITAEAKALQEARDGTQGDAKPGESKTKKNLITLLGKETKAE